MFKNLQKGILFIPVLIFVLSSDICSQNSNDSSILTDTNSSFSSGLLPAAVSIFPGILLHGAGHWAGGDKETGIYLLKMEGLGFGLFLLGTFSLGFSGASEAVSAPAIITIVSGLTICTGSWILDFHGSSGIFRGSSLNFPP